MDADSALQWAQANPDHPKAKAVLAKAWAMKNPNDPRSGQIMQKLNSTLQQAANPQTLPDAADKAAHPNDQVVNPEHSSADTAIKMAKMNPEGFSARAMKAVANQTETPQGVNQLGTALIPGSAAALSKGAGFLGRMGTAGLAGGTAAVGVGDVNASPENKLSTFLKGGALGAGIQGIGEGASKIGDWAMQQAVGLRKYTPGVGTSLADQGVVGTKGMMANQVEAKLNAEEEKLQDVVKNLSGVVSPKEIADAVAQKAQRFTLPSTGQGSPFSTNELQKVRGLTDELSKMGDLNGSDLLALKRQGDWQGYTNSGNPATSLDSELGRTGANAAREALKKMSPEVGESLAKERALVTAKTPLNKPDSIPQSIGSALFWHIPGTSLGSSLTGQAATKGSKVLQSPEIQRAIEQGLFGDK
jgi:hypothetical protein